MHFASATTAILQAMDIPARYVFGYRFFAEEDRPTPVTDKSAHAWTEVYCPGIGWLPVESTAGEDQNLAEQTPAPTSTPEPTNTPTPEPIDESPEPEENTPTETPENGIDNETPEPVPTEEPQDNEGEDPEQSERQEPEGAAKKSRLGWLWLLLIPPAVVGGLWLTGKKVREKRQKLFSQEDAKQAILEMYHYLGRLKKYGVKIGNRANDLDKEAAFSNHVMSEERKEMKNIVTRAENELKKQPKWKVLIYKRVLFLL